MAVVIKDITLPDNMRRAMAKKVEGEFQTVVKFAEAADIIASHPVTLQLRALQTMADIATEKTRRLFALHNL